MLSAGITEHTSSNPVMLKESIMPTAFESPSPLATRTVFTTVDSTNSCSARDFDLPPLLFTSAELTELVLGARLVQAWGAVESVDAAGTALQRIEAVLPSDLRDRLTAIQM